jgi:ATP-dependent protease Clp ATPase subunit
MAGKSPGDGGVIPGAIRTKHVLFIFSGAFNNLRASVEREEEEKEEKMKEEEEEQLKKGKADKERGLERGEGELVLDEVGEAAVQRQKKKKERLLSLRSSVSRRYTTKHFVEHGMEPEFVGRVPVRVGVHVRREKERSVRE